MDGFRKTLIFMRKVTTLLFLLAFQIALFGQSFTPGVPVLDSNAYVEYIPGNLPIIISAPHGGYLEPTIIPDRSCTGCVYTRDAYTQEISRALNQRWADNTGCYPHVIINLLHRKKFDANRSIETAADSNVLVERSFYAYHRFIDSAKAAIQREYGRGIFLDVHGHGHSIQRLELGYLLTASQLRMPDSVLELSSTISQSSIRTLEGDNLTGQSHSQLIRGALSFGSILESKGVPAVPSSGQPAPMLGESYFSGGYNTHEHGSKSGGAIDAIQLECHQDVRFDSSDREEFVDSLYRTVNEYMDLHFFTDFDDKYCNLFSSISPISDTPKTKIFPNPVQSSFKFSDLEFGTLVQVFNTQGQLVQAHKWTGRPISASLLPKGFYLVKLLSSNQVQTTLKMAKQ